MKTLQPVEDAAYYFDEAAADAPCRFVEKFCRHFEGRWAGTTLHLLDWQRELCRTIYGWKRRDNHHRKFTEIFLLTGKGAGKTPLLAAIGMYELFAGGEPAAHVVSMGTDYKQAMLSQEWAKKAIQQDRQLSKLSTITQYEIRGPRNSKWSTISGNFAGRAGFRPSCVLADEAWEWPNSKCYDSITANLFKRRQPLLLVATNAAETVNCFAWQLYDRAKAVLAGKSARQDLLPVICEAETSMAWDSEEAARAACPSIPEVITFDSLRPKIVAAREEPALEREYRRLHLSQWIQDGKTRWLDLAEWDANVAAFDPTELKGAVMYVGLDLSLRDDLCAADYLWVTPDHWYVDSHFWLPRNTADEYKRQHALPFDEWEKAGAITLLPEPTISPAVRRRIAAAIVAKCGSYRTKAICYDRYKADDAIAALEAAKLLCVPVPQGYTLTPGCAAIENRLTERSITIAPNPVLRLCAENVEITYDQRGNFWPVKPNAKNKYAGKREMKIDGIAALVTAATEARKHSFPAAAKQWSGGAWIV